MRFYNFRPTLISINFNGIMSGITIRHSPNILFVWILIKFDKQDLLKRTNPHPNGSFQDLLFLTEVHTTL